jgi:hypothetical protein
MFAMTAPEGQATERFQFGENWTRFLSVVDEDRIAKRAPVLLKWWVTSAENLSLMSVPAAEFILLPLFVLARPACYRSITIRKAWPAPLR